MAENNQESLDVQHVLDYCNPGIWIRGPAEHPFRIIESYRLCALKKAASVLSGSLLDFGCGTKPYENHLRSPQITQWVGVDLQQRTTGLGSDNKADTFWDGVTLPFKDNSFDIILATQVLEHVKSLDQTVSEMARVLKTGGTMLITVPMTSVLHEEPWDFRRFTPYGIKQVTNPFGLRLDKTIALGGVIPTVFTLLAGHINFISRIPIIGKLALKVAVGGVTQLGVILEMIFYKLGFRQAKITTDYLFILKKG